MIQRCFPLQEMREIRKIISNLFYRPKEKQNFQKLQALEKINWCFFFKFYMSIFRLLVLIVSSKQA